jgi:hypothetical protein
MDLVSTLGVLARRWYAAVPVLVVALAAAALVPTRVPPTYRSTASVLFVHASTPGPAPAPAVNPYLIFDQALVVTAGVVAASLNDATAVEGLRRGGANADFTLIPQVSRSPIIDLVVTDEDAATVLRTTDTVLAAIDSTLKSRQAEAGAPAQTFIRPVVVSRTVTPMVETANRTRAMAAVGALGIVLSVGTAFLAEARAARVRSAPAPSDPARPTGRALPPARSVHAPSHERAVVRHRWFRRGAPSA